MDTDLQQTATTKRKFSRGEIESHNKRPFDLPILNDSVPVTGVYFSFEEFKSNKPGVTEFEVVRDKIVTGALSNSSIWSQGRFGCGFETQDQN